jgi:DNA processing protein
MITAKFAAEYGRQVFAVPGRIDQPSSSGCLSLIRDGATMLTCVEDVFEDLPYLLSGAEEQKKLPPERGKRRGQMAPGPQIQCPVEKKILDAIHSERSADLDILASHLEMPIRKIARYLQALEMRGLAQKRHDGMFEGGHMPDLAGKHPADIARGAQLYANFPLALAH